MYGVWSEYDDRRFHIMGGKKKHTYTHAIAMTNLAAGATPLLFYAFYTPNNHTLSYITQPNNNCLAFIAGLSIVMVTQIALGKEKEAASFILLIFIDPYAKRRPMYFVFVDEGPSGTGDKKN